MARVKTLSELECLHASFRQPLHVPQSRKLVAQMVLPTFPKEDWRLSAHADAFQLIYSSLSHFNSGYFVSFSHTLLSFSHRRRCEELVHDRRKANHNPPLQEKSFLLLLKTEHSSTCTSHFITLSNTLAQWCMILFKFIRVALGTTAFKTFKVLQLKFINIYIYCTSQDYLTYSMHRIFRVPFCARYSVRNRC